MPISESGPKLDQWFIGQMDKLDRSVESAMRDVAEKGQQVLQDMISTRGTANSAYGGVGRWSRTFYSKSDGSAKDAASPGREWTGDMKKAITHATGASKTTAFASFGWLERYEDYFGYQEAGFYHVFARRHIPGMFIFHDTQDIMVKYAEDRIGVALHEF